LPHRRCRVRLLEAAPSPLWHSPQSTASPAGTMEAGMEGLGPRKEQILRAVIVEYVTAAEPVPSELIATKYELGVRNANVRTELAEIPDLGLLDQPHPSAGRVPSDRGYRYYVDRLVVHQPPDKSSEQRIHDAADSEDTLRELLTESTKALSRLTHLLSAAA